MSMTDGYMPMRVQFFCRDCGHRFTADADVSDGGTGTSYSVAWRDEAADIADDECPYCGSDDTAMFQAKPRKGGAR